MHVFFETKIMYKSFMLEHSFLKIYEKFVVI